MRAKALILDLDDTIFQTSSMNPAVFEPFFDHLREGLRNHYPSHVIASIIDDLWKNTWDVVVRKYEIPLPVLNASISLLNGMALQLKIATYPDYKYIRHV